MDFDFISESLLPSLCPQAAAPLQVGAMSYDVILVPQCQTLRSSTLQRLEAFQRAGGTLIFLGNAPAYENARPSPRGQLLWSRSNRIAFTQSCLLDALEPYRTVAVYQPDGSLSHDFIHQLRQDGQDKWLFLAHSRKPCGSTEARSIRIEINGCYNVLFYDTLSGQIRPLPSSVCHGKTHVQLSVFSLDSILLRLTARPIPAWEAPSAYVQTPLTVPALLDYSLDEPNVLLLDKAEYALDQMPYRPEEELLRADTQLRKELGWRLRTYTQMQPWAASPCTPAHTIRLRFCVYAEQPVEQVKLALEDASLAQITLNGVPIPTECDGWFTDKAISTVPLGTLHAGENRIEVTLPYGEQTNLEWCYLLGNFGVCCQQPRRILTPAPVKLAFGDLLEQGLPHYGGNITYRLPLKLTGNRLRIQVPDYHGVGIRVTLQQQKTYLLYPPYSAVLEGLCPGECVLQLTLLGHRNNCFGPVHMTNTPEHGSHPRTWHTTDAQWTDAYELAPLGIDPPVSLWEEQFPDITNNPPRKDEIL